MSSFISIGNGTQSFARLLDQVRRIAPHLPQPVVVQHGWTPFHDLGIEHFDFTDEAGFRARLEACTVFITHGGGGSVFAAIRAGKKPIVVPRLKRFDEIVDDHQLAFARELEQQGKIVVVHDVHDLLDGVERLRADPDLPADAGDNAHAVARVGHAVAAFAPHGDDSILLVAPSGGHLAEIRALAPVYRDHRHHFVINTPIAQPADMVGRTSLLTLSERDWKFVINIAEAVRILRRERPRVILTTGGSISVAFTVVGRILGIPTVYVETVAKVVVPTVTGRIQYRLAARFLYQWRYLASYFPRGEYIGLVL
jgi:UDP-N-acetylglucosamine transferase subunit ALG13